MDYEPKPGSKVAILMDAMRAQAETRVVWSQAQAATVMDVPRSMVPTYVAAVCNHKLMHRRTLQNGIELSLQRFDQATVPTYEHYEPQKVAVPREGSDVRAPKLPLRTLCPGCSRSACWDEGCQQAVKDALVSASVPPPPPPPPTPPPSPESQPDPRVEPGTITHMSELQRADLEHVPLEEEPGPALDEQDQEGEEPEAFIACGTGEIILVNCPSDDEGRVTIPADLVAKIRSRLAWGPLP